MLPAAPGLRMPQACLLLKPYTPTLCLRCQGAVWGTCLLASGDAKEALFKAHGVLSYYMSTRA